MFKTILSYLWGTNNVIDELTLEKAFKILEVDEEIAKDDKPIEANDVSADFACFHKNGVITSIKDDVLIIDDLYEYKSEEKFEIGDKVSYTSFINKLHEIVISNVHITASLWDNSVVDYKAKWCERTDVFEVIKRNGRLLQLKPGDVEVDLNHVKAEFIPIEGDWVELDVISEIDENISNLFGKILEIKYVRPLRPKLIEGIVRDFDANLCTGNINRIAFFYQNSIDNGYLPKNGDFVIAEVIESNQGRFAWRAIKILLKNSIQDDSNDFKLPKLIDFQNNVKGITITDDLVVNNKQFNEISMIEITILNELNDFIELCEIKFDSNHQIKLNNPPIFNSVKLGCKEFINFEFKTRSKMIGVSKELIIFVFNEFNIGRYVTINLETNKNHLKHETYIKNKRSITYFNNSNDKDLIRGQTLSTPPRFITNRLGDYKLPEKMINLYANETIQSKDLLCNELIKLKPCLNKSLSYQNYEERFHTLLHIEEINQMIEIKQFDQERACFIKNGAYLMLEIENLSEKRPSIIIGDRIMAQDPFTKNAPQFEGCVHKVTARHVYLKFNLIFHESYKNEDFSIHVIQSRTKFRKLHQAIGLAVINLGRNFLFPTQVVTKAPQINFTYDKYDDIINTTHKKILNRNPKKRNNKELLLLIKNYSESDNSSDSSNDLNTSESKLMLTDARVVTKYVKEFKLDWFDKSLNYFQKEAVRNILLGEARPLPYFIFGPPGTGKTVTLIETILQILRMLPHSRILVGTPSNSAADLLAIRLIDSGSIQPGDLVRLVAFKSVCDNSIPIKLIPYSGTCNIARDGTTSDTPTVTNTGLTLGCSSSVIGRHRITVGTCITLGSLYTMGFPKGHFTHVIIDEAGQGSEPETMIPLVHLDISDGHAILAGDPMQLGPVIRSKEAREFGLKESLLDRFLNRFPYTKDIVGFPKTGGYDPRLITKLVYNYRSLPGILDLPNKLFYQSELRPTICEENSVEARFLQKFCEILPNNNGKTCLMFHGIDGNNYQTEDSPSWFNPDEASQVFYYINEFYRLGATSTDIAIISPYVKQVRQIRDLLKEAEFDVPKVGTVEEMQGQEFKIVIISTVRSSKDLVSADIRHSIGFIGSSRRFNVALTRAQCLTLVIGNPNLLTRDSNWRHVLNHCVNNGSYIGCDLPNNYN